MTSLKASKPTEILINTGTTILKPSGPKNHLFTVLFSENNEGNVLIAPFTTQRHPFFDKSCIIEPGEHSFINEASYINYYFCESLKPADLMSGINSGIYKIKDPVSSILLQKIQNGYRISEEVRKYIYKEWPQK